MAKIDPATVQTVILDAGPLIHLDELGCLSLLRSFQKILVPAAVWAEVDRHRPSALRNNTVRFTKSPPPDSSPALIALCEAFNLDTGEREALSVCFQEPQSILLTDDAAVRLAAKASGIRAYGTLGIVVRAIRRKLLTPAEVISLLEQVPAQSTLFIRKSLLREIIEKVKNEFGLD